MSTEKYCIKQVGFIPPPYGGVSVFVKRLIDRLNADGYVSGGYYMPGNADPAYSDRELHHEWKWLRIRDFLWRMPEFLKEIRDFRIVHSHLSMEGMLYLWFAKAISKKRMIITVHNSMVVNYFRQTSVINRVFLRLMARTDARWIAVSQQAKEQMLKLPLHFRSEIEVIPAYIPMTNGTGTPLPDPLAAYLDRHDRILVFYGHSFMDHAGDDVYGFYDMLVMYAKLVAQCQGPVGLVYCISDQSDSLNLARLRSKAEELGVHARIYWQIGALQSMQSLWAKADVYARPTSTDGDSVAVREALDQGVRVVASDVCPRPDGVCTYKFGDTRSFVETVARALQSGRAQIHANDVYYQRMLSVYEQLSGTNLLPDSDSGR